MVASWACEVTLILTQKMLLQPNYQPLHLAISFVNDNL